MDQDNIEQKEQLAVLQATSLRDLVDMVNAINHRGLTKILKEDIVAVLNTGAVFSLLYYK